MSNTTKKSTSWGWIVFWFIVFWPIGVFLLIKKLDVDKSATMEGGKILSVVSFILMGMGAIYLIMAITGDSSMIAAMIVAAIVCGVPGIWLFLKAKKTKATGERYKKYIAAVINQNQTSIDNVASAVDVTYEVAVKDLQKMIDAGYFADAYIDATQREIVLARTVPQEIVQDSVATRAQVKVVACGSCGANNGVTAGQIAECEYCGSLLQ